MGQAVLRKSGRLHGLDFARFLAFAGMVFVNFHVVTGMGAGADWASGFLAFLEGKAAATFVVLAGIGLGFGAARAEAGVFRKTILKRAFLLLVIGLLNSLIFPADILHYYAVYFVFGVLLIGQSRAVLISIALFLPVLFVVLAGIFDYGVGWNFQTFEYADFWTIQGFARNLMFNGWHPVVPWLSFLMFGMLISRMDLVSSKAQNRLILWGGVAVVAAYVLSGIFTPYFSGDDLFLVSISPVPPMPLYMLVGSGSAAVVIGLCLKLFAKPSGVVASPFITTGKQALTLYMAHVVIGMGVLEAFGLLGGQSAEFSIFTASLFIIFAVIYAVIWARFFKSGPIEWLMRRIAG